MTGSTKPLAKDWLKEMMLVVIAAKVGDRTVRLP